MGDSWRDFLHSKEDDNKDSNVDINDKVLQQNSNEGDKGDGMTYTKEKLVEDLREISEKGFIKNKRPGNQGGVGNTLEDLLGIPENNIPLADAGEYELKTKRNNDMSMTTLFHKEPYPRKYGFVPNIFLPKYGWPHDKAGGKYPEDERSFRVTMSGDRYTNRGFTVNVNRKKERVEIEFNPEEVSNNLQDWLSKVEKKTGGGRLDHTPYWSFDVLEGKIQDKLKNTIYITAKVKREDQEEYYHYNRGWILEGIDFNAFLDSIETGSIRIDFDARTGHNHGTKFRFRKSDKHKWFDMYETRDPLFPGQEESIN